MKHEVFLNGFDIIIFKCINPFSKAFYMYHTRYKAYKTICYIPHKTFHRRQRVHHRNTYYDSFKMMKSFFFRLLLFLLRPLSCFVFTLASRCP